MFIIELWKDIEGYEGYYQISNYGRVKNVKTNQIMYIFNNYKECANFFGLNKVYIQQCCRGLYKLKGKYKVTYDKIK